MQYQFSFTGPGLKNDGKLEADFMQIGGQLESIVFRPLVLGYHREQIRDQHQLFIEQPVDFVAAAPPEKGRNQTADEKKDSENQDQESEADGMHISGATVGRVG